MPQADRGLVQPLEDRGHGLVADGHAPAVAHRDQREFGDKGIQQPPAPILVHDRVEDAFRLFQSVDHDGPGEQVFDDLAARQQGAKVERQPLGIVLDKPVHFEDLGRQSAAVDQLLQRRVVAIGRQRQESRGIGVAAEDVQRKDVGQPLGRIVKFAPRLTRP